MSRSTSNSIIRGLVARARDAGFDSLLPGERAVVLAHQFCKTVFSRGLEAYLAGPNAASAADTMAALRHIGDAESAQLLADAIQLLPAGAVSANASTRRAAVRQAVSDQREAFERIEVDLHENDTKLRRLLSMAATSMSDLVASVYSHLGEATEQYLRLPTLWVTMSPLASFTWESSMLYNLIWSRVSDRGGVRLELHDPPRMPNTDPLGPIRFLVYCNDPDRVEQTLRGLIGNDLPEGTTIDRTTN
jgi:hypothetical protein